MHNKEDLDKIKKQETNHINSNRNYQMRKLASEYRNRDNNMGKKAAKEIREINQKSKKPINITPQ